MQNTKTSPKDFFLHLLSAVTLYMVAISFSTLLFQYVNHFFPDVLENYYTAESINSALRFSISMLLVALPVYGWAIWSLRKIYKKEPEKKDLWIRRWLTYFTIFVAAIIIIIDMITLINNYLGGEFTIRFFLKVLAVLVVATAVFSFYLLDIKDKMSKKIFLLYYSGTISLIFGFIFGGFFLVGSPAQQRMARLDNERVSNLESIYYNLESYYADKGTLPTNLEFLNKSPNYFANILDPETGYNYKYNILTENKYQLCAIFALENIDKNSNGVMVTRPIKVGYDSGPSFWKHGSGEQCFDLEAVTRDSVTQNIL
ncbi:MAG: hypothetical protein COX81_02430 [Candidatus Magasanikbacteria bacterium CG_4_10_14_0_2_um_filter_37_12]|uniref:DUF5671 domain-containing protein n=1 Tax=Candidatus Magasanikbacteria bacterium CG_4_10_14_0_2_um_filter_37_12 TaxID=1974637 RepID=A0A2M7V7W0_9BACT|nr:MAG: hypothetical protein COX81_02430 [Candidatus Magasanikbacteria bacterium CG_4_10_14_0_2_um_filter_37_12]